MKRLFQAQQRVFIPETGEQYEAGEVFEVDRAPSQIDHLIAKRVVVEVKKTTEIKPNEGEEA